VKRLELKHVRLCQKCGRARAELETPDGQRLSVPMDAVRARELSSEERELGWLEDALLARLRAAGAEPAEVVLDAGPTGLRGLLSVVERGDVDVIACTPQEAIGLSLRGRLRLYATPEALASDAAAGPGEHDPGSTVH
jgi:hypothetical protein